MTPLDAVTVAMARWPAPRQEGSTIIVPTHCLYPTNHIVNVYVEAGGSDFLLHENGDALDQLRAMGGHEAYPNAILRAAARRDGLKVSNLNRIFASGVPLEGLEAAVALLANVARDAADMLIARHRPMPRRPLSEELEAILNVQVPSLWRKEETLTGESSKHYKFDYTVALPNKDKLIIETVKPDASSINAAVVANLDVRNANPRGLVQRIVYDDHDKWPAESLRLLRVGAPPIAVSSFNDALRRLAA